MCTVSTPYLLAYARLRLYTARASTVLVTGSADLQAVALVEELVCLFMGCRSSADQSAAVLAPIKSAIITQLLSM